MTVLTKEQYNELVENLVKNKKVKITYNGNSYRERVIDIVTLELRKSKRRNFDGKTGGLELSSKLGTAFKKKVKQHKKSAK